MHQCKSDNRAKAAGIAEISVKYFYKCILLSYTVAFIGAYQPISFV